ncbi:hypothetical protein B0G84_5030 [Paraburkholderia sp. BL8N3]|nr:hypothetical protein [Paraburkholderia sp. BL8N3]TCK39690.1 hypothetical protein B0G84_5030 [Paraburkholderia sp. BL8N3]
MTDEQKNTLRDLLRCFMSWEPQVRVLGNVRADDAAFAIQAAILAASASDRDSSAGSARQAASDAGPVAWFDKELNTVRWKDGLVNADFTDGQPFFTRPAARADDALTDEQIKNVFVAFGDPAPKKCHVDAARALLAAKGKAS